MTESTTSTHTRSGVLDTAKHIVTKDRNASHGEPEDSFASIATMFNAYLKIRFGANFTLESHDVAILMNQFKVARLAANPDNADNWIDSVGYMACGAETRKIKLVKTNG